MFLILWCTTIGFILRSKCFLCCMLRFTTVSSHFENEKKYGFHIILETCFMCFNVLICTKMNVCIMILNICFNVFSNKCWNFYCVAHIKTCWNFHWVLIVEWCFDDRYALLGTDMNIGDYDGRTALHVGAAEGNMSVVRFLLEKCKVHPFPKDR